MYRLLIPFFLVCMAGLIGLYVLAPQYEEIQHLRVEEAGLKADLQSAADINQRIAELESQYANFPHDAEAKLGVMLPDQVDSVRFIIDMNALVVQRGLEMLNPSASVADTQKTAQVGGAAQGSGIAESSFAFTVMATWSEFRALLRDIERSLALRDMSTLSFAAAEVSSAPLTAIKTKNGEPVRAYSIKIMSYSYR